MYHDPRIIKLEKDILRRLDQGLDPDLSYHCAGHTSDVLKVARELANAEGLASQHVPLLEAAALFHDTGFLFQFDDHEKFSCRFARDELPRYGFSGMEIGEIEKAIEATRLPQTPVNQIGKLLCDADLDYLGRDDFWEIGDTLFKEFLSREIISDEKSWNRLQVSFLENHRYFTDTNRQLREPNKQIHLEKLKSMVAAYD